MEADLITQQSVDLRATYDQQATFVAIDALFAAELNAAAVGDWLNRDSMAEIFASDQMIDIAELYDTSFLAELDRPQAREAVAEPALAEQDVAAETPAGRLRSRDAGLMRFRFHEFAWQDEEEDDDQGDSPVDDSAEGDEQEGMLEDLLCIDEGEMIEMTHNGARPDQLPRVADSQTDSAGENVDSTECADQSVEYGAYVRTEGGATRYQAFDIGADAPTEHQVARMGPDSL